MTHIKKVAEKAIELAGKAPSKRPWNAAPCYNNGRVTATRLADIVDDCGYSEVEDGTFAAYACNNIEQLARDWLLLNEVAGAALAYFKARRADSQMNKQIRLEEALAKLEVSRAKGA